MRWFCWLRTVRRLIPKFPKLGLFQLFPFPNGLNGLSMGIKANWNIIKNYFSFASFTFWDLFSTYQNLGLLAIYCNHLLIGMILHVGILAYIVRGWWRGVQSQSPPKRQVFGFHETILRRWARISRDLSRGWTSEKSSMKLQLWVVLFGIKAWRTVDDSQIRGVRVEVGRKVPLFTRFWHPFSCGFLAGFQKTESKRRIFHNEKSHHPIRPFGSARMPCHLKWRHSWKRRCDDSIPMPGLVHLPTWRIIPFSKWLIWLASPPFPFQMAQLAYKTGMILQVHEWLMFMVNVCR